MWNLVGTSLSHTGVRVILIAAVAIPTLMYLNRKMFLTIRLNIYFRRKTMTLASLLTHPRNQLQATNDELQYMDLLLIAQFKKRLLNLITRNRLSIIIDDFLYHSNLYDANNITLLKQHKIRHIISVCNCPPTKEIVDNFNVLWIAINDDLDANIYLHFEETNELLCSARNKNEKVLVHCKAGVSRSSTIILAYLMKYHQFDTLTSAYQYLLDRRPIIAPNSGFLLQLIRYERELEKLNQEKSLIRLKTA